MTLQTLGNLGVAYRAAGRLTQAIELHEQLRDIKIKKFGADHPETLGTLNNLAVAYRFAGKLVQAAQTYEQLHDGRTRRFGPTHADTIAILEKLDVVYTQLFTQYEQAQEYAEAEPWRRKLARLKDQVGPDSVFIVMELSMLAQPAPAEEVCRGRAGAADHLRDGQEVRGHHRTRTNPSRACSST